MSCWSARTLWDNGKLRNREENGLFFYNGKYLKLYQNRKIKKLRLDITNLRKLKNLLKAIMREEIIIWNTLSLVALTQFLELRVLQCFRLVRSSYFSVSTSIF